MDRADVERAARGAMRASGSLLRTQIDARTELFGRQLTAVGGELRRISGDMRQNPNVPGGAELAARGADLAQRAGTYLAGADSERLITDAENFTRRRPLAAAATAAAIGFALSRVLKAASSRRYHESTEGAR